MGAAVGVKTHLLCRWLLAVFFLLCTPQQLFAENPQSIDFAFAPDLSRADEYADQLIKHLEANYEGLNSVTSFEIQFVHAGAATDFPREAEWIIAKVKHAFETNPKMPHNVKINLKFVSPSDIEVAQNAFYQRVAGATQEAENLSDEILKLVGELEKAFEEVDRSSFKASEDLMAEFTKLTSTLLSAESKDSKPNDRFLELQRIKGLLADFKVSLHPYHLKEGKESLERVLGLTQRIVAKLVSLETEFINSKASAQNLAFSEESDVKKEESKIKNAKKKIGVSLRSFFGLPQGTTWIMYKLSFKERSVREHVVELASSLFQSAILFGITYTTLEQKLIADPALGIYVAAGAWAAAGWKGLTGYIERANNAFFVQGVNFNPFKSFSINQRFFLVSAYVHSIIIGASVQYAVNGHMTSDIFSHTALNSFLGLFAKAVPLMLIAKHQIKRLQVEDSGSHKHTSYKTIAFNFLFGVTYQGLKSMHLFGVHTFDLDKVFVGLGVIGFSYEMFKYIARGARGQTFQERAKQNLTYLVNRTKGVFVENKSKKTCRLLLSGPFVNRR